LLVESRCELSRHTCSLLLWAHLARQ
jgi:hypothetical protein